MRLDDELSFVESTTIKKSASLHLASRLERVLPSGLISLLLFRFVGGEKKPIAQGRTNHCVALLNGLDRQNVLSLTHPFHVPNVSVEKLFGERKSEVK
jgi:hypothetical protein